MVSVPYEKIENFSVVFAVNSLMGESVNLRFIKVETKDETLTS